MVKTRSKEENKLWIFVYMGVLWENAEAEREIWRKKGKVAKMHMKSSRGDAANRAERLDEIV